MLPQKGGAGKTTLAINLAVASELAASPAAVVDLDPQASAAAWADSRKAKAPVVVSAQAARLADVLATAREHGAALAIIDTAPHAEAAALAAARAADLVLVPCRCYRRREMARNWPSRKCSKRGVDEGCFLAPELEEDEISRRC